jgi:predicted transcriptional regulator
MEKTVKGEIPKEIKDALDSVAKDYSRSKATTNAGAVLRFFARFLSVDTVIKLFAHKVNK